MLFRYASTAADEGDGRMPAGASSPGEARFKLGGELEDGGVILQRVLDIAVTVDATGMWRADAWSDDERTSTWGALGLLGVLLLVGGAWHLGAASTHTLARTSALGGGGDARGATLGALALDDLPDAAEFFRRSVAVPGDPRPLAAALARARASGALNLAIVGGSVSAGGGHTSCGLGGALGGCGRACCGAGWHEAFAAWLRAELGIATTVSNAAVGATGPELAALCVGTLFPPAALAAADVVVVEYAVNTDGGAQCVRQLDRLLWRLRRLAPRAAIVFVHAYSLSKATDAAASCLDPVARAYAIPALSWRAALFPLLRAGALAPAAVLEPPIWHHPNVRGHAQLAAILAHFALDAEARAAVMRARARGAQGAAEAGVVPVVREPLVPAIRALAELDGSAALHARLLTEPLPACAAGGDGAMERMLLGADGWALDRRRRLYASARAGAVLALRFACARAGCGLRVGLTRSYQPLGFLNVHVDGAPALLRFSEAQPGWRARGRLETVNHFVTLVRPSSPAQTRSEAAARAHGPRRRRLRREALLPIGPLAAGNHTITFTVVGETEPAARAFPSNYRPHEVQVRSLAVFYDEADDE